MKQTVDFYQFRNAFTEIRPNNFTYEGLSALFDHLTEYEESVGEEMELDVIAICCEFSEYADFEEIQNDYNVDSMEDLQDNTIVIEFEGGIIIQRY